MKNPHEPDYEFWSKLDRWNFKEAALLLQDIDPLEYKQVQFSTKALPDQPELKEAYKTFLLLKKTSSDGYRSMNSHSASPQEIYMIAFRKGLAIPEKLAACLKSQEQREQENRFLLQSNAANNSAQILAKNQATIGNIENKELSTRERKSLLKSIGILTLLLTENSKSSAQFTLSNRPNAFRITEAVITKAEAIGVSTEGLKSLDRKIKDALDLLEEE
jgi:hypothetical protein